MNYSMNCNNVLHHSAVWLLGGLVPVYSDTNDIYLFLNSAEEQRWFAVSAVICLLSPPRSLLSSTEIGRETEA